MLALLRSPSTQPAQLSRARLLDNRSRARRLLTLSRPLPLSIPSCFVGWPFRHWPINVKNRTVDSSAEMGTDVAGGILSGEGWIGRDFFTVCGEGHVLARRGSWSIRMSSYQGMLCPSV